jgi:hypothetical protein
MGKRFTIRFVIPDEGVDQFVSGLVFENDEEYGVELDAKDVANLDEEQKQMAGDELCAEMHKEQAEYWRRYFGASIEAAANSRRALDLPSSATDSEVETAARGLK